MILVVYDALPNLLVKRAQQGSTGVYAAGAQADFDRREQ